MAKADLLLWLRSHRPPLVGVYADDKIIKCSIGVEGETTTKSDYDRFNAVTTAAEARATLLTRTPPLTVAQVEEAMVEYLK